MKDSAAAPDLLTAVKQTLFCALVDNGIEKEAARHSTLQYAQQLLLTWGGESHWLPHADRSARDAQIQQALSVGTRPADVARTLTVSIRTVRRIKSKAAGLGKEEWCL